MRLHISIDDDLVSDLDRRVGARKRSAFITETIRAALEDERRWDQIMSAAGTISGSGHAWDDDPAAWVRAGRRADPDRVG